MFRPIHLCTPHMCSAPCALRRCLVFLVWQDIKRDIGEWPDSIDDRGFVPLSHAVSCIDQVYPPIVFMTLPEDVPHWTVILLAKAMQEKGQCWCETRLDLKRQWSSRESQYQYVALCVLAAQSTEPEYQMDDRVCWIRLGVALCWGRWQ